jgi:hypothetical protein
VFDAGLCGSVAVRSAQQVAVCVRYGEYDRRTESRSSAVTKDTFPKRHPVWTVILTLAAVIVAISAIGACAGEDQPVSKSKSTANTASTGTGTAEAARPAESSPVAFAGLATTATVHKATFTIRGRVAPADAKVTVNDSPAKVRDGAFSKVVKLDVGTNDIEIYGRAQDHHDAYDHVSVTRKRTAAEIAAAKARREAAAAKRRAEAKARHERYVASYKASAKTIPYSQLNKNADAHAGERVKYYGQILQIQEEAGLGGIMLLSVTDEGYDIWDDNVWVNYTGSVKGAEGDKLTVYGTVVGSRSYETQIGGETYVPEIDAKYIEE